MCYGLVLPKHNDASVPLSSAAANDEWFSWAMPRSDCDSFKLLPSARRRAPVCSPALVPAACRRPATLQPRTLLTRRPLHAHDGTDGGDLAPGEPTSLRALCT